MTRICIIAFIFWGLSACKQGVIGRRAIQSAEDMHGVHFSRREHQIMRTYLESNREGYDSMRRYPLSYQTPPSVFFDPRPQDFEFPVREQRSVWPRDSADSPLSDAQIAFLPVSRLGQLIQSRQLSSVRLTRIYLDRLKKFKDTLQCVVTITEPLALKQAEAADEELSKGIYRGPLHGIPYGIKDLFSVPGYPTTWGAEPYRNQILSDTSEVVRRLEEAGAVLIAKLTSGALARGDVWFGGKTKNPWDLKQGASGSSAGSASATSAGLVGFAIGTETLGSIVAPSSRCGATGLRPSFGSVSRTGAMTLSWSMDKVGPICRTALDCAIVFNIIRGKGKKGDHDRAVQNYSFSFVPKQDLRSYRIGYNPASFKADSMASVGNNHSALEWMKKAGGDLIEMKLPEKAPYAVFDIILRSEAGAFFDELVRTHRDRELLEQDEDSRANSLRQSRFIPAVEYIQANRHRYALIEEFNALMKQFDFIVVPANSRTHLLLTNLTGHPAISIPTGLDKEGHPTSIILIGNLYDEGPILEAAYHFQKATQFEDQHPEMFTH